MAIHWTYDERNDVLIERCNGGTNREEMLGLVAAQRSAVAAGAQTRYLCDYRSCTAPLSPEDLRQLARDRARRRDGGPLGPHALVVDSDLLYGIGRMLQAYFEFYSAPHENQMRIFRCEVEALRWLGLSASQIA